MIPEDGLEISIKIGIENSVNVAVRKVDLGKLVTAEQLALAIAELEAIKRELVDAYEKTENLFRRDEE